MRVFARFLGLLVFTTFVVSSEPFRLGANSTVQAQTEPQNDRKVEADSLLRLGIQQHRTGQFRAALRSWEAALALYREIGYRQGEASSLGNVGLAYRSLGEYERAIDFHQQHLAIAREIGDRQGEATSLSNLGLAYGFLGQYERAIDFYQQSLDLARKISARQSEANALGNLGLAYFWLGEYGRAIDFLQQQLIIVRQIGDLQGEANALGNLSNTYFALDQYERAIDSIQQVLIITRQIGARQGEATSLVNLGSAYFALGQYERAIDFHQQSLAIVREIGDREGEANALGSLGLAYDSLGQYERGIDFHQQSLAISRELGDREGEATSLVNLGNAYLFLGQYERAIDFHQQSLSIAREIGDRKGEASALGNLGTAYRFLGRYKRAIDFYQQGLTLSQGIGDRSGASIWLNNLGRTFSELDQTELAIVFLKASVDIRESIRGDIQGLETDLQQSFTDTVADDYRFLANLLLEEGRIPEAQQVLDLLKLEELREFTRNTRATWTGNSLEYSEREQPVIEAHTDLIAFGKTLFECEQTGCERLSELYNQLDLITEAYDQQVALFNEAIRNNRGDDTLFQDPDNLSGDAQELLAATPDSVLIYPFVTEDKLWLLYATVGSVGSIEVNVSQGELSRAVQHLGERLSTRGNLAELQATSQELYGWLIKPLEEALERNNVQQLIFVNDRVTRYIPMAVLHDGDNYLIERYAVSSVLSPALTDTDDRLGPVEATDVLGLGLTKAVDGFNPLPAVAEELDNIVLSETTDKTGIYPGQVHLDEAFTLDQLKAQVANHRVLHVATHAAFVPGRPESSFIVLGDGNRLKIPDIETMARRLNNLHLVVLSACQTALGGEAGDGSEIAGLSAYFLEKGRAEAVLASLWLVDDTGTSLLMQRFYELMASGELTKAEALQQAQLSLLYDQDTETRLDALRASITLEADGVPTNTGLQHPFYWAPFILIGNGL